MRRHRQSIWSNTFFSFAAAVFWGIGCIIAASLVLSALSYFVMGSTQFLKLFSFVSIVLGAYASGHVCGKYRRRRGLIDGCICGALMYAAASAVSLIVSGSVTDIRKLLLLTAVGAAGGVAGVNTKRPKRLMDQ